MGKDNILFHSLLAPATLQSTGVSYVRPQRLAVTEYLMYEGGKFSKSNNIGLFGDDCMKMGVSCDVWRYVLLVNRPENSDTHFSLNTLSTHNRTDLLNNLGNLFNRILKYAHTNFPAPPPALEPSRYTNLEHSLINDFETLIAKYCKQM
jgi:methionyl-tRNA synthetase